MGSEWNSEIKRKKEYMFKSRLYHEGAGKTPQLFIWQTLLFRLRKRLFLNHFGIFLF